MVRTLLLAGLALCALPGCWYDACVLGGSRQLRGVCEEQLDGILIGGPAGPEGWCTGELNAFSTCSDLGYTRECDSLWVQPGSFEASEYCQ